MKVKELIYQLKKFNQELEVVVFVAGETYNPESFQLWDEIDQEVVEIGCGWNTRENSN